MSDEGITDDRAGVLADHVDEGRRALVFMDRERQHARRCPSGGGSARRYDHENATVLLGASDVVSQQVIGERANRGEPVVCAWTGYSRARPRHGRGTPSRGRANVVETERRNGPAGALGDEYK
jgi:hypothetical protein